MGKYKGKYCSGIGDVKKLKVLDDCFSILYPSALLPNISMVYNPDADTLREGFIWGNGFWLQNSYGFIYGAIPFLQVPWAKIVQNSLDLHWDRIGDGKRIGTDNQIPDEDKSLNLCAPDGSLGDSVLDKGIVYKQGDGDFDSYDWFYEATASALNIQADILLANRDAQQIEHYLPLMKRSAEFIERVRDKINNLFLVGPGCNLLAPSYGAARNQRTGRIENCYLAGLSITYCAALQKMVELFALANDAENEKLYMHRYKITKDSLHLLLTKEGYFLKYIEQDGTMHGCYGQEKFGYMEGVCNIDALAFHVADEELSRKIYDKIASIPGMRPFDFLVSNYPGLDDTPWDLKNGEKCFWKSGDWVDGGCWGTVEGRAVLAYLSLGQYEDAFRSVSRMIKWAEDYRMDAPFSQWGENLYNTWANEYAPGKDSSDIRQIGVALDNFAVPACMLRGLLGCKFDRRAVIFILQIPEEIRIYSQHVPIRYGSKELLVSVINGNEYPAVTIDGKRTDKNIINAHTICVDYTCLEQIPKRRIEIIIDLSGGEVKLETDISEYHDRKSPGEVLVEVLPENMVKIYRACLQKFNSLHNYERESEYGVYLDYVIEGFRTAAKRRVLPFDKENFRPMTQHKHDEIISLYDVSAMNLYKGLKHHYRLK